MKSLTITKPSFVNAVISSLLGSTDLYVATGKSCVVAGGLNGNRPGQTGIFWDMAGCPLEVGNYKYRIFIDDSGENSFVNAGILAEICDRLCLPMGMASGVIKKLRENPDRLVSVYVSHINWERDEAGALIQSNPFDGWIAVSNDWLS